MSSALDRMKDADDAPPDAPAAPVGAAARDTADLREGVRRAHGFALTDDEMQQIFAMGSPVVFALCRLLLDRTQAIP